MATSARNTRPVQLRLALKASKTLIPLALFALAFAAALVVLKRPGVPAAVPAKATTAQPVRVASLPAPVASAEPSAPEVPSEAGAALTDQAVAPARAAPPVPETIAGSDGPPEVVASADATTRTPDDVSQAIDTLRDGTPQDRVLAIQALATTGHSGRSLSRVRQSLRFAASDQDPDVAARAREAYDSLLERDDP
jgi:hypothetical protein